MKKRIIIAGVPRAGKSTVSNLISEKYGYNHISMDSIIAGFEQNFPELGINTYADLSSFDILKNISAKIAPFISSMMGSGEYDEFKRGSVYDIYQLLPCDYVKHIDSKICGIYYFITSEVTPEERYDILKKFDTERDYTFYKTEQELREGCGYIVEQSKYIAEECKKYNLPYFETAFNRIDVIDSFINMISHQG